MSSTPSTTPRGAAITARNKHNALARYRPADDPDVQAAKRALVAARAEQYIRALVDGAPALTESQRSRLAVLLLAQGTAA